MSYNIMVENICNVKYVSFRSMHTIFEIGYYSLDFDYEVFGLYVFDLGMVLFLI